MSETTPLKKPTQLKENIMDITKPIDFDGTSQNVTDLFDNDSWESGNGPLDADTLASLGIEDVTHDERWFSELFECDGQRLGCYRDEAGNHYILWYVEDQKTYSLQFEGDENAILEMAE